MLVPELLRAFADLVNKSKRACTDGNWGSSKDGVWSMKFMARLSVPPSEFMPAESIWHLVVEPKLQGASVQIYPDKKHGITATFPHQEFNREAISALSWRLGKPCLEKPLAAFGRESWSDEPSDLFTRMSWKLERLLKWIDAAAADKLMSLGDPLELPAYPKHSSFNLMGFNETSLDYLKWTSEEVKWGFASIATLKGAQNTKFITKFLRPDGSVLKDVSWGASIRSKRKRHDAVWLLLDAVPVLAPWQPPSTWLELAQQLSTQGVDLGEVLMSAGIALRKASKSRGSSTLLLLGFPLSERVGMAADRLHWLAVDNLALSSQTERINGFRTCERNFRARDYDIALLKKPLTWLSTMNWAVDQIRTRGAAEDSVCSSRVLVIGAGALGGAVSENLLRMGVTEMGILDYDFVSVGNLSRHVLSMHSTGHNKAAALVERLNSCMPDASVRAYKTAFPPGLDYIARAIRKYNVIVDCTGEDDVIDALSKFDWEREKLFISLAMTWKAEGLFAYAASEIEFPVLDAKSRFSESPVPKMNELEASIEGIGCWHPVFPATADDVQLWGAIGSKFIRRAILHPCRRYEYFRQLSDGSVECFNG